MPARRCGTIRCREPVRSTVRRAPDPRTSARPARRVAPRPTPSTFTGSRPSSASVGPGPARGACRPRRSRSGQRDGEPMGLPSIRIRTFAMLGGALALLGATTMLVDMADAQAAPTLTVTPSTIAVGESADVMATGCVGRGRPGRPVRVLRLRRGRPGESGSSPPTRTAPPRRHRSRTEGAEGTYEITATCVFDDGEATRSVRLRPGVAHRDRPGPADHGVDHDDHGCAGRLTGRHPRLHRLIRPTYTQRGPGARPGPFA